MSKNNYAYLCDGMACERQCARTKTPEEWAEYDCHHTRDESHARNKCRRERKFNCTQDMKGNVYFEEKDPSNEAIDFRGRKQIPMKDARDSALERKPVDEFTKAKE